MALRVDGSKADTLADKDDNDFFMMFNAGSRKVNFSVCDPLEGKSWMRTVDTALPSPEDVLVPGTEQALETQKKYAVQGRSMVILISKLLGEPNSNGG
jgi:glycogen operon protein